MYFNEGAGAEGATVRHRGVERRDEPVQVLHRVRDDTVRDGEIRRCRGASSVWNYYLPPDGGVNCSAEVVETTASVDANSIGGGDLNWVGARSMQDILQGQQTSDEVNDCGKKYLGKLDEEMWSAWPMALRTLAPQRSESGTSNVLTCWCSEARSRCDELRILAWPRRSGYENLKRPDMVSTDHEMVVPRIGLPSPPKVRSWRGGARRIARSTEFRAATED